MCLRIPKLFFKNLNHSEKVINIHIPTSRNKQYCFVKQGPDQGRKRPLKTKRRRSSGSGSGSKKPKLETTENTTGGTTSSGKKKLPRKAKENKTKVGHFYSINC